MLPNDQGLRIQVAARSLDSSAGWIVGYPDRTPEQ